VIKLVSFVLRRFCKVHRYKERKYHRLDKPHKHFKEIEWDKKDISDWKRFSTNFCCDPEHHSEEDNSSKNVSKKTK